MEEWIFEASPLILLGKIGRLDIIERLNPNYAIPAAVAEEIFHGPENDPALMWLSSLENTHPVLEPVVARADLLAWDLGSGETEVLAHCLGQKGRKAILDDRAARNCAEVYGVAITGTVGLLLRGKKAGLISLLKPELRRLVESGSLLSEAVVGEALRLAGE